MTKLVSSGFLPFALPDIGEDEIAEVVDTLRSGWLTSGPKTRQFEEAFTQYLPNGVASVSPTDLIALLQTHIVTGRFPLEPGMELPTLNNKTLLIGANVSTITLGGTKVTADILGKGNFAINGVLYSIDKVLVSSTGGKKGGDDGLSTTWIIVIAVAGSVAAIAVLAVVGYFGYTYWQKKQSSYVAIGGDYEN